MPPKRGGAAEASAPKGRRKAEIKEAFSLFCEDKRISDDSQIPINEVRRAMKALDLQPTAPELSEFISILDPDEEGFAVYSSFLAICALKLHQKERTSEASRKEVEDAFRLFASGGEEKITLAMLKRVARLLKEDVPEEVLNDMILEANGGRHWSRRGQRRI
ncbi:hypothetical protein B0O99DRAFT_649168 [Bisporella sp. PMI_857]|nr:hypothetical protein B0O99DRAFT_612706 [Bisporella sp. PMI_857]KAH8600337.1 hypothetical protein B0O99DRAFT_649168 [Bisporella sp. PMI_857]